MIHPRTQAAIDEVKGTLGEDRVAVEELPDGAVWLTITRIQLGSRWSVSEVDLAVKLVTSFPDTQPYPWYLPGEITRTDGHVIPQLQPPAVIDGHYCRQLSVGGPWTPSHSLVERIIGVERWLRNQRAPESVAS